MKKIGLKDFAKFISAGKSARENLLRRYKFPQQKGNFSSTFYSPSRQAIREFIKNGDEQVFYELIGKHKTLESTSIGRAKSKSTNTIRVAKGYLKHFSGREFKLLSDLNFKLQIGDVSINASPDLHVEENGKEKIIKLEYSVGQNMRSYEIILMVLHQAQLQNNLNLDPLCVHYFDIERGTIYTANNLNPEINNDILSACENISSIWDSIETTALDL